MSLEILFPLNECIEKMPVRPDLVLVDAVELDTDVKLKSIIKGDATSYNIAAASILAKVTRDRIMREMDALYPEYGFAKHKGYGTKAHYAAIEEQGISPIHRRTFLKNIKTT